MIAVHVARIILPCVHGACVFPGALRLAISSLSLWVSIMPNMRGVVHVCDRLERQTSQFAELLGAELDSLDVQVHLRAAGEQ